MVKKKKQTASQRKEMPISKIVVIYSRPFVKLILQINDRAEHEQKNGQDQCFQDWHMMVRRMESIPGSWFLATHPFNVPRGHGVIGPLVE